MGQDITTHVANAYTETVMVKVDSERFHVEKFNAGANLEAGGKIKASEFEFEGNRQAGGFLDMDMVWNKFIEAGFAKIPRGEFAPFSPKADRVYVTVWSPSNGYIWKNIEQIGDISFIVKEAASGEASVVKSKYGTIWMTEAGAYLKP